MTTTPSRPRTLDDRALNRATLSRQMLLERTATTVAEAVERLVGMQAQAPLAPYVGLWSRIDGFEPDHLAELEAAGRALLDERPCTNGELREALAARWPERDATALATAMRALVPMVQAPPRGIWGQGGQAKHISAEAWLGRSLAADPAPDRLVVRYLAGFGPATVGDAQVWSGLTRLGEVFERLRPQLVTFADDEGRELFDLPDAPRPDPDEVPAPVRFLPEYDNLLRSHEARSRVLSREARDRLATKNDSPKPTFLVDGVVAGGWKVDRKRRSVVVTVEPFVPLDDDRLADVTAEAERLAAFATPADAAREVVVLP